MKQSFLTFAGKKFLTAAFLSASVLFTSFQSNAATTHPNIEIITGTESNVQFTGSTSDALMFKVNISNANAEAFTLIIKNGDNNVLYSGTFKDANFEKTFKVLKSDDNSDRYYFTINSASKNLNETYVVSTKTHTVDDVTVNKL